MLVWNLRRSLLVDSAVDLDHPHFKRLAHGDVDWGTYEVNRLDEIGELARVYTEFRQITIERTEAQKKSPHSKRSSRRNSIKRRYWPSDSIRRSAICPWASHAGSKPACARPNQRMVGLLGIPADDMIIGLRIEELLRRSADMGFKRGQFEQLLMAFDRMWRAAQKPIVSKRRIPLGRTVVMPRKEGAF